MNKDTYTYTLTDMDRILRDVAMEVIETSYTTYLAFGGEPVTFYKNECPRCHDKKASQRRRMLGNYCSNCGQKLAYKEACDATDM